MLQVTVWCLTPDLAELKLKELHKAIVAAVVNIDVLGIQGEEDVMVLFPPDMMKYGAGSEVLVQVSGLWEDREHTPQIRKQLAQSLGVAVRHSFQHLDKVPIVKVRVDPPFNPDVHGYWTSEVPSLPVGADSTLPLLDTPIMDFFTKERFLESGVTGNIAGRAIEAIEPMTRRDPIRHRDVSLKTMRQFLAQYDSRRPFLSRPKVGEATVNAIVLVIKSAGLPFSE